MESLSNERKLAKKNTETDGMKEAARDTTRRLDNGHWVVEGGEKERENGVKDEI